MSDESVVEPLVEIEENGPYHVTGDIPLRNRRILYSDAGESIAWRVGELIAPSGPYRLCRCGQSNNKPYCDNTHRRIPFDGTETAPQDERADRAKAYEGDQITLWDDGVVCQHAKFCSNQVTSVWKLIPDTADPTVRAQVIGMVDKCPSGALSYEIQGEEIEPDHPLEISVVDDGPLWLTGRIPVLRSDGKPFETRHRVTVCRCGRSQNKPLCDGSHHTTSSQESNAKTAVKKGRRGNVTFGHIVAATDDADASEAVTVAARLARTGTSKLDIVFTGWDVDEIAVGMLETWGAGAGLATDRVSVTAGEGHAADATAALAEEVDAGLIVIDRGGSKPSHQVHRLAHRAPCDLLVVGAATHDADRVYRRITVATDGSATADRAARRGYHVARVLGAAVDLVFVGHTATGKLVTTDTIAVYGRDVDTTVHLLEGDPADRILEAAHESGSDLIVTGNKGLAGVRGALLGSVPRAVLDGATGDVLVCRTVRQVGSQLEVGEGGIITRHGEPLAAYRAEDGELKLMSARCTHLGCTVDWNPAEMTFDCPCHGSRFGPGGEVVEGPATRALPPA